MVFHRASSYSIEVSRCSGNLDGRTFGHLDVRHLYGAQMHIAIRCNVRFGLAALRFGAARFGLIWSEFGLCWFASEFGLVQFGVQVGDLWFSVHIIATKDVIIIIIISY